MSYSIVLTEQADSDLRGIYEYIAFSLLEPEYATAQLGRLENNILSLAEMPQRFKLYEKEPWYSRGLRQMLVVSSKKYPAISATMLKYQI
ncbi:type II toxin-antitoxin system RelE/ParE family toxin [Anaerosporobacter sp.]|uniref:type II toxin-antitoxin system RelE/ParE family toxin n=1 Tax=Anaerosporobacter sp. TaxID=1872529 RepID=UPI00286EB899|nr:type II toxin-antitoxin system RelE/ParE family toxin [Anaerosporobacter sp.]